MRVLRILLVVAAVYVGIVIAFESLLGFFQPDSAGTIVITTADDAGHRSARVVSSVWSDGRLYVSANHWPRAWYEQALAHPKVEVAIDGRSGPYTAVPVSGPEHDRLMAEHGHPLVFRVLTGFPPRHFLRLDPG
ncbi:MAG: nitroreductase/quinone reductase family protein [Deltaproteobacteria bacterium]|nr:nitroreductase/quinone reductase family protein [Deltaproteobacteria bacterium]